MEYVEVIAECPDGFSGLKSISEMKPDLVFLDIQMPRLTGIEMLEVLNEKPEIIFTTAYDQFAIKAFELNAVDYLLKPFPKRDDSRRQLKKRLIRYGQEKATKSLQVRCLQKGLNQSPL